MKASPSVASWRSLWYMRRQILVAGTSFSRARPKASIDHEAVVADFGEGVEVLLPADVARAGRAAVVLGNVDVAEAVLQARMALGMFFSSMWAWNVSYIILQYGWFTSRTNRAPSAAVLSK